MYVQYITDQVLAMSPLELQHTFHPLEPNQCSDLITIIEPVPGSRSAFWKRLASRPAFDIVWDLRIRHRVSDMQYHYDILRRSENMTPAADWAFEVRMHDLLRGGTPSKWSLTWSSSYPDLGSTT